MLEYEESEDTKDSDVLLIQIKDVPAIISGSSCQIQLFIVRPLFNMIGFLQRQSQGSHA